tara:strand:+ start:467 stop:1012 length:546 start_codon:yes stop_codon:yes gene_type:complete
MGNKMKHFSIDEDTMNALMELISDAYVEACNIQDKGSIQFYAYLLGELENAKYVGESEPLSKDEEIRMKKLERYLRMLQRGLNDPKNEEENNKRRKFARDILNDENKKENKEPEIVEVTDMKPYFSESMKLPHIESILQKMTNISEYEKYKIYCSERDRRKDIGQSLDEMCKDIGIKRAKK